MIKFFRKIREKLDRDSSFRAYFEGESVALPDFYLEIIKKDLGYMLEWLPNGAIYHDSKAYLKKHEASQYLKKTGTQ